MACARFERRRELAVGPGDVTHHETDDRNTAEDDGHRFVRVEPLGNEPLLVGWDPGGIEQLEQVPSGIAKIALPAVEDPEGGDIEAPVPLPFLEAPVGELADLAALAELTSDQMVGPQDDDGIEHLVAERIGSGEIETALVVGGCRRTRQPFLGHRQIAPLQSQPDLVEVSLEVVVDTRGEELDGPVQVALGPRRNAPRIRAADAARS